MKFIRVTTVKGKIKYLNVDEIRYFEEEDESMHVTCIVLRYGTMIVQETPEELFTMLGGD